MPALAAKAAPASAPGRVKARRPRSKANGKAKAARASKRRRSGPKMTVYRSHSAMIPIAAGRAAVAVREIPDSNAVVRLTRGRAWIAVLGALLAGIVALNVISLGLTARSGKVGQRISTLERSNSALRAEIAESLSATRVEGAAATLGLAVPAPADISYLTYSGSDLERAAKALASEAVAAAEAEAGAGELSGPSSLATSSPAPAPEPAPAPDSSSSPAPSAPSTPTQPSGSAPPSGGGGVSVGL